MRIKVQFVYQIGFITLGQNGVLSYIICHHISPRIVSQRVATSTSSTGRQNKGELARREREWSTPAQKENQGILVERVSRRGMRCFWKRLDGRTLP
jgi:light-regulated signal transduction histidine kinase (bacteriophytochrome)